MASATDAAALARLELPEGLAHDRTTRPFDSESVPAGLLRAHRVAPGVWGELVVHAGEVTFVVEATGTSRALAAGETQVIEPDVAHHVEPNGNALFEVRFHR